MAVFVETKGPPKSSMQYGIDANNSSRISLIALGWPGKLTMSVLPRIQAVWRYMIAVGT